MGGKQPGHNDISPTKLNGIHHTVVINTNRVEMIDSTDYNTSCNCEMRWDGDGDGADVGDDVDDDLDDARDDDDDDGDDLPSGGVLPSGICPLEMSFLLCRFPPRSGGGTLKLFSPLGILGDREYICQRGEPGVAPRVQAASRR